MYDSTLWPVIFSKNQWDRGLTATKRIEESRSERQTNVLLAFGLFVELTEKKQHQLTPDLSLTTLFVVSWVDALEEARCLIIRVRELHVCVCACVCAFKPGGTWYFCLWFLTNWQSFRPFSMGSLVRCANMLNAAQLQVISDSQADVY